MNGQFGDLLKLNPVYFPSKLFLTLSRHFMMFSNIKRFPVLTGQTERYFFSSSSFSIGNYDVTLTSS